MSDHVEQQDDDEVKEVENDRQLLPKYINDSEITCLLKAGPAFPMNNLDFPSNTS